MKFNVRFRNKLNIWGLIPAYTKNCLVFWSGDKKLSSGADAIG